MKMAFLLNEYRPFGGLARDCLRLAREAAPRGHSITIVTRIWQGEVPEGEGIELVRLGRRGLTNHQLDRRFIRDSLRWVGSHPQDLVLGFLRMPGLDAYFAADPCYQAMARRLKPLWFRFSPRYHRFVKAEREIFGRGQRPQILLLHPGEIGTYQEIYATEGHRLHLLPPGIRRPPCDPESGRPEARRSVRRELGMEERTPLVLLAGSGFRTKGLDRAVTAIASHPEAHLVVAGEDKPGAFRAQAGRLGISQRLRFIGGRSDLDRWMLGSDLLVHPAYSENTGTVLLEALVLGLPVISSAVCGFSSHVSRSRGGVVLSEPFSQKELNAVLRDLLDDGQRLEELRRAGIGYGVSEDLYGGHRRAVDLLESLGRAATPGS